MTKITASKPFESWFNFDVFEPIYDFDVRVCLCTRVPPRDKMFEYFGSMGRADIERLFEDRKPLKTVNALWVFPENWLTVHEQQALMYVVDKCGLRGNLQSLHIITQSPLIVGDFTRGHIRIISTQVDRDVTWWKENKKIKEQV